jgi:hypothetical protein
MSEVETKKCRECHLDIPKEAKRCSGCTADQRPWAVRNPIKTILLVLFGLPIFFGVLNSIYEDNAGTSSTNETQEVVKETWKYETKSDELTGEKQYFASTISTNLLEFDFPFHGGTSFQLIIRDMNKGRGEEVVIFTDNAQFLDYDETIKVRFDESEPVTYNVSGSDDGSMGYLFVSNSSNFITKLKASSKVRIEAPFFEEGRQVIYFDTKDYKGLQK